MPRRISFILLAILLITGLTITTLNHDQTALAASYVGASTTGKFHYESCRWAQKIRNDHRVYFGSRDEAIDAGYVPCKVCKP